MAIAGFKQTAAVIKELQTRIDELEKENARLKEKHEGAETNKAK